MSALLLSQALIVGGQAGRGLLPLGGPAFPGATEPAAHAPPVRHSAEQATSPDRLPSGPRRDGVQPTRSAKRRALAKLPAWQATNAPQPRKSYRKCQPVPLQAPA